MEKQNDRDKYEETAKMLEARVSDLECLAVETKEARQHMGRETSHLKKEVPEFRYLGRSRILDW